MAEFYRSVMFDDEPNEVNVFLTSIQVVENVTEIEVEDEEGGKQKKWQGDVTEYSTTEYVKKINERNDSIESELTMTQTGLAEAYELIIASQ